MIDFGGRYTHGSVWMTIIMMMICGLGFGFHVDIQVRVKEVGDGGEWANRQNLKVVEIIK